MSNAIPYKYFPLVYGVCIALDCLFMPLLLRRQSVNGTLHGRNQLIAIDVVLDLVGGCLLPFFCFGPMVLALVENPPMLRRSDWSIQALSISLTTLLLTTSSHSLRVLSPTVRTLRSGLGPLSFINLVLFLSLELLIFGRWQSLLSPQLRRSLTTLVSTPSFLDH